MNTKYLQEYWQRITEEARNGQKIDFRWEELKRKGFSNSTGDSIADQIEAAKKKQQLQDGAIVAGGAVVLAAIVFLIIVPSVVRSISSWRQIQTQEKMEKQLIDKKTQVEQAHKMFFSTTTEEFGPGIFDNIEVIDQAIPDYSDLGGALKIIGRCLSDTINEDPYMVLQSLSVETIPTDTPLTAPANSRAGKTLTEQKVTINMALQGEFRTIRQFINQLKSMRHNFQIDQIVFASSGNTTILTVNMTVSYYYYN